MLINTQTLTNVFHKFFIMVFLLFVACVVAMFTVDYLNPFYWGMRFLFTEVLNVEPL